MGMFVHFHINWIRLFECLPMKEQQEDPAKALPSERMNSNSEDIWGEQPIRKGRLWYPLQ